MRQLASVRAPQHRHQTEVAVTRGRVCRRCAENPDTAVPRALASIAGQRQSPCSLGLGARRARRLRFAAASRRRRRSAGRPACAAPRGQPGDRAERPARRPTARRPRPARSRAGRRSERGDRPDHGDDRERRPTSPRRRRASAGSTVGRRHRRRCGAGPVAPPARAGRSASSRPDRRTSSPRTPAAAARRTRAGRAGPLERNRRTCRRSAHGRSPSAVRGPHLRPRPSMRYSARPRAASPAVAHLRPASTRCEPLVDSPRSSRPSSSAASTDPRRAAIASPARISSRPAQLPARPAQTRRAGDGPGAGVRSAASAGWRAVTRSPRRARPPSGAVVTQTPSSQQRHRCARRAPPREPSRVTTVQPSASSDRPRRAHA